MLFYSIFVDFKLIIEENGWIEFMILYIYKEYFFFKFLSNIVLCGLVEIDY